MKIKKKTTKQKLLWLRDLSRDSWPMLIFMLMYILVFTLLEKATRLHYTVIHSPLDDRIPFIEYFVVPYFMWFGYIAFNMISERPPDLSGHIRLPDDRNDRYAGGFVCFPQYTVSSPTGDAAEQSVYPHGGTPV